MTIPILSAASQQHHLTGTHRVRVIRPMLRQACRLMPRVRDYFELRSQCLKLRFWPTYQHVFANGHVLDLDWEWIRALKSLQVGELRIDDVIGGKNNLRVIFFVGDESIRDPLPMIWILSVLQKKRQDFTEANIECFRARRTLVIERFYKRREFS
jgi:hypothetical protein